MRVIALCLLFCVAAAGTGAAADREELEILRDRIEESADRRSELERERQELAAEARALQQHLVAAAKGIQAREREIAALDARLAALEAEEKALVRRMAARREQTIEALMALQRLTLYPPDSLVALRRSPTETVRSALLLRAAVPRLQADAAAAAKRIERLAELRENIAQGRDRERSLLDALRRERDRLDSMVTRMRSVQEELRAESATLERRITDMAARAESLADLVGRLEREAPTPPQAKPAAVVATAPPPDRTPIDRAQGELALPAIGEVVQSYGDDLGFGTTSRGIKLRTRPRAQVVAPYDGTVAFAGPFRGYGLILIIDHGDRYHSLLAGMAETYASVGQPVLAGEPVGIMGDAGGEPPELYVELRRGGQPVNPSPWLAGLNSKEKG